jgi:hypothetical protein
MRTNNKINYRPFLIGIVVFALMLGGIAGLARLQGNVSQSPEDRPGETLAIQGQEHIAVGAAHPDYNSNPPTSGWHYAEPADWGIYDSELPDEQLIHNLEHGGVWISHKDVDAGTLEKLKAIAAKYPGSVVLGPRSRNDAPIAIVAWGKLQKLQVFDQAAIETFIRANKNQSPEPIAK